MICFRKDKEPNDDIFKKLQSLLDAINNPSFDESLYDIETDTDFHQGVDISQIINIIYKNLFTDNCESIGLLIEKNPNNSLDLTIDKLK
jgi:hypothetical protein